MAQREQPATAAGPVEIDLGSRARRTIAVGAVVSGGIGLVAVYSALTGGVEGGTGTAVAAGIIGGIFLLIGLLPVVTWRTAARPRKLVLSHDGIRMDDPRGAPWTVAWDELAAVAISRTEKRRVKPTDLAKVMVRLDLFPADAGFRARHPEMEPLWELHRVRDGYRLPFGSAPQYVPVIDQALRRFRPDIYLGVRDEGFSVGLM